MLAAALLISAGCGPVLPSPSLTPSLVPTATLLLTFTPLPTDTSIPASTPTPTQTPVPSLALPSGLGKLAYVSGDDIWVKEMPDGEAQRLTSDGINRRPRWSPSGQWLAYLKGDELWVAHSSGAEARAIGPSTPVRLFAWSPVSDTLAYTTHMGSLRLASADNWLEQELAANPSGQEGTGVLSLAWSPDGEWIAYSREEVLKESQPGQIPKRSVGLWIIRADGSQATERFSPGTPAEYGLIVAGWSAEGEYILFWTVPIFSASLQADATSLMAIPASNSESEPRQIVQSMLSYPDFIAPDPSRTSRLAVVAGGGRESWTEKTLHIFLVSTGEPIPLPPSSLAFSSPSWSPEGQRLAFAAMRDQDGQFPAGGEPARQGLMQRHLWMVDLQGTMQLQQLTNDPAYRDERPLWSADGDHLLFVRLDNESRVSLWLIPLQGGEPRRMVDELTPNPGWFGYYGHVDWDDLFDWWRETVSKPVPTAALFPAIYPSPVPLMGTWKATAGCPNPKGLEEFEFGMPVETVIYSLEELWSGDLERMRRVTDPALWPLLIPGEGQAVSVSPNGVRTRQSASASPYADRITALCREEITKLTWHVEVVCPKLCSLLGGLQSRSINVFLLSRNGWWLIWAIE